MKFRYQSIAVLSNSEIKSHPPHTCYIEHLYTTQRGDLDECIRYLETGLETANALRNTMTTDEYKRSAAQCAFQSACVWLVSLNAEKGDYEKVFNYAEQYKGRALLDLLGSESVATKRRAVKHREEEQRTMLARLEDLQEQAEQARKANDSESLRSLERNLAVERTRYERLAEDVSVANLEIASIESVDAATWEEIQPIIKGFTLVNYVIYPWRHNTAVIVSEDGVIGVPLDFRGNTLQPIVEGFRKEIGVKTGVTRDLGIEAPSDVPAEPETPEGSNGDRLFELLIEPVLPHIKTDIVYISSHDVLNYVPFDALRNKDGRYLVEDYAIAYTPSASVLKLCMDKERRRHDSVLALGNPNLRNPEFRLVHAENEVNALEGLFPKVDVYTFDNATETIVKQLGGDYDILHFACHGELNLDEPMLTSLRLTPDGANDGYLHAGEVFELNLAPSLVVLSACNSALGELSTGNELMGLTRSFLYAGAPSIIASLWMVDDRSTAFLMEQFYKNLATMNKAEALRQAKLATMKEYPSPFHWAPFCLQGDYR